MVDSYQGVGGGGGQGVGITSKFFFVFFLFVPLSFGLSYPVSFLSE